MIIRISLPYCIFSLKLRNILERYLAFSMSIWNDIWHPQTDKAKKIHENSTKILQMAFPSPILQVMCICGDKLIICILFNRKHMMQVLFYGDDSFLMLQFGCPTVQFVKLLIIYNQFLCLIYYLIQKCYLMNTVYV